MHSTSATLATGPHGPSGGLASTGWPRWPWSPLRRWLARDTDLAAGAGFVQAPLTEGAHAPLPAPALTLPTSRGQQLPVLDHASLVAHTQTAGLIASIERRTRLSTANFERDCTPVLQAVSTLVQLLPASEAHHHAQPGGLWIHLLEVADAALTFRAGMEIPAGASTELRKSQEHRWTMAVLLAALLHDIGKLISDVRVLIFDADPHAGRVWTPLAGSMHDFGATHYQLTFAEPDERSYSAHARLGAMLVHPLVPGRVLRWLSQADEVGPGRAQAAVSGFATCGVLGAVLNYLAGDDPDGTLAGIIKRADSDSVRRNLLTGPRTRFASARTRPLVERLMQALQRMLHEGGHLPLNRPGAAGWVFDGSVWFVCARLADEVRNYLAQHESAAAVPGKDRNDRLFDTWQEFGAALPAPDGGAVWRVRVRCDGWSPPDPLTVLRFPLERLYRDPAAYPGPINGCVWLADGVEGAPADPPPPSAKAVPLNLPPRSPTLANVEGSAEGVQTLPVTHRPFDAEPAPVLTKTAAADDTTPSLTPSPTLSDEELLLPEEVACIDPDLAPAIARSQHTPVLVEPMRPKERVIAQPGVTPKRQPSAAAQAFMAWVAHGVSTGALTYNQDSAPVHFVNEGVLLLSPELFRRFLKAHTAVVDGPVAALRASHGDKALNRLQNELAKSGWTVRNGDENLHHYAFVKADGQQLSRSASFFLIDCPQRFWLPVPAPNARIRAVARPGKGAARPGNSAGEAAR